MHGVLWGDVKLCYFAWTLWNYGLIIAFHHIIALKATQNKNKSQKYNSFLLFGDKIS